MKKTKKKNNFTGIYLDAKRGTYYVSTTFTDKSHTRHKLGKRGFTTPEEANEWKEQMYEYYNHNYINRDGKATTELGILIDKYLKSKSRNCKELSVFAFKNTLETHFLAYFDKANISDLNKLKPTDINDYYTYLADLDLKDTSKNVMISRIHSFIDWLDLMEFIEPSIARKFKQIVVKFEEREQPKNDYLNESELQQLLNSLDENDKYDKYYRLMIITLVYSGLRRAELFGLTWGDLDPIKNTLSVNKQYQIQLKKVLEYTKTNINRLVYIPNWLTEYLVDYRNSLKSYNAKDSDFIFPHRDINKRLKKICEDAGIKHIKVHDLRHTFCTMLYDNGASGKYVQTQMGHTNENTSKVVYEHLTGKMLDEGIEITNSFKKI